MRCSLSTRGYSRWLVTTAHAKPARAVSARAIAEGALFADLTVLIVLLALYIPYAGPVLATISSMPLLLLILRQGWRIGLQAMIVALVLVGFLTGPLSATAVGVVAARAAGLGFGMRRRWNAWLAVVAGATIFWAFFYGFSIGGALIVPSWRAATEQGLRLTYDQGSHLLGSLAGAIGASNLWQHQAHPWLDRAFAFFIRNWLWLLPLLGWPVICLVIAAEYVIAEAVLPPFGYRPRPLRLPLPRPEHPALAAADAQQHSGDVPEAAPETTIAAGSHGTPVAVEKRVRE
jgi:hypothetical protein